MFTKSEKPGAYVLVGIVMLSLVTVLGMFAVQTIRQQQKALYASEATSSEAKERFYKESLSKVEESSAKNTPGSSTSPAAVGQPAPSNAIVGNNDTSKQPALPSTVPKPVSPKDSIVSFVNAFKSGDFVTANALIGPSLAKSISQLVGENDPTKALEACRQNFVCTTLLSSFTPPENVKESYTTTPSGVKLIQYSFLLSSVNEPLASAVGDRNIDVFMLDHAGVWVIHDMYIDGKSLLVAIG